MDWRMTGEMSVGVVFAESSRSGGPTFSTSERNHLRQEIIDGLSWLVARHPAGDLSWIMDYQYVTIDVADQPSATSEDYWRYPAVAAVNYNGTTYAGTWAGLNQYLADMHAANSSDRELLIFVTPFHCHAAGGFAGGTIATLNSNGDWAGWGSGNVDRIAAHETCHIFGAADEYTGSGTPCTGCDGTFGIDDIPNGNCGHCARPQQGCIMDANERHMCAYTRAHIGWADDLFVELTTGDEMWAGTDDHVELDIGTRVFTLDTEDHNDRERGNREGYALWTGGVGDDQLQRVMIRKRRDEAFGGWLLERVRLWHHGVLYCDQSPSIWLEDDHLTWTGCANPSVELPISTLVVRVTTYDDMWAGTDDDVTLRLADRSWDLDNSWHDDFERGNTDTFSLDPGTGLYLSNIHAVTIEKSGDGVAGGWHLAGLEIEADGATIFSNPSINTWLEDESRVWTQHI